MGPLSQLFELLPKAGPFKNLQMPGEQDEGRLVAVEALIDSMTPKERRQPQFLDASRKRRIVRGSGRSVQELNQLLKQYKQMRKMMKRMKGGFLKDLMG
jgi:signal recognition particle subunit SRP54